MENIHLKSPYKVIASKLKRYSQHYALPIAACLVVPKRKYGDQISCDVLWKDDAGKTSIKSDLIFEETNLEPLNALKDFTLYNLWEEWEISAGKSLKE